MIYDYSTNAFYLFTDSAFWYNEFLPLPLREIGSLAGFCMPLTPICIRFTQHKNEFVQLRVWYYRYTCSKRVKTAYFRSPRVVLSYTIVKQLMYQRNTTWKPKSLTGSLITYSVYRVVQQGRNIDHALLNCQHRQ